MANAKEENANVSEEAAVIEPVDVTENVAPPSTLFMLPVACALNGVHIFDATKLTDAELQFLTDACFNY